MAYELCFLPLRAETEPLRFACDSGGRVDLDVMDRDTMNNYLYARALTGWHFSVRVVQQPLGEEE